MHCTSAENMVQTFSRMPLQNLCKLRLLLMLGLAILAATPLAPARAAAPSKPAPSAPVPSKPAPPIPAQFSSAAVDEAAKALAKKPYDPNYAPAPESLKKLD